MGGGNQSQSSQSNLSPELGVWATRYINALGNLILPNQGRSGPAPSPLPYQEVAPLSPQQMQGMNLVSQETYGPGGAPSGGGIDPNALQQAMMATPYWQMISATQPSVKSAISPLALNQLPGVYS